MKNNGEKEAEEDGVGGRGGDGKATEGNSFREKRQRREGETRKLKKWTKGGGGERDREKEREARFVLAAVWHGRISIAGESETVDEMMKDGGRERERKEREPKVEYR